MTMYERKQEEIKTIRGRRVEIELSDADIIRVAKKAGAAGLTIGELIKNFIGDLVCGTYSNGSDERMYAQNWFERCWFGSFSDETFLRFLIENDSADDFLRLILDVESGKEEVEELKTALEETNKSENDILSCQEEIAALEEDILYWQNQIDDYWNSYKNGFSKGVTGDTHGTFEEETKKVIEWKNEYTSLLEN